MPTITIRYRTTAGRIISSPGWIGFTAADRRAKQIVAAGGTILSYTNMVQ